MQEKRVHALDWLRAIAVMAVVVGHARIELAPGGAVGVSVFFALSGYLICAGLLKDGMLSGGNIVKFTLRRISRVYPMYLLHIGCVSAYLMFGQPEKWALLKPWLLGLLTFTEMPRVWVGYSIGVLWTLFAEIGFYLTFPLLLVVLLRKTAPDDRNSKLLLAFALIGIGCFALGTLFRAGATVGYYDHFLLGAAVAVAAQSGLLKLFDRTGTMMLGLLLIAVTIIIPYTGDRNLIWHLQSLIAALGSCLVIGASVANPPKYQMKAVAFIGRISFSMYLVHAFLLDFVAERVATSNLALSLYLAAVIAISAATFRFIEDPIQASAKQRLRFVRAANAAPAE